MAELKRVSFAGVSFPNGTIDVDEDDDDDDEVGGRGGDEGGIGRACCFRSCRGVSCVWHNAAQQIVRREDLPP